MVLSQSCQESTRGCGLPNGIPIYIEAGAKYSVTSLQYSATSHLFSSKTTCNPVFGQCNNACFIPRPMPSKDAATSVRRK